MCYNKIKSNCIISCYSQTSDFYFYIVYRVSRIRSGASRTYINHSVLRCVDGFVASVAVYESQTATLAAHTPKPSYHNTKDKLVVSKSTFYTKKNTNTLV